MPKIQSLIAAVLATGILSGNSIAGEPGEMPPVPKAKPEEVENCVGTAPLKAALTHSLDMKQVFVGQVEGVLLELFANQDGKWIQFLTSPDGISCVLLTGEGWRVARDGPQA